MFDGTYIAFLIMVSLPGWYCGGAIDIPFLLIFSRSLKPDNVAKALALGYLPPIIAAYICLFVEKSVREF